MDSERITQKNSRDEKLYKCIILECHEQYFHVLTDQGEHLKIKSQPHHKVGEKIYFLEEDIFNNDLDMTSRKPIYLANRLKVIGALAAIFLIMVIMNFPMSRITYAVISLDINPSIELKLNKSGEIIHANGFNLEAIELLSKLQLEGLPYEKAIDVIFNQALLLGYTIDQHSVLIAVAPVKSSAEDMISDIENNLKIYQDSLNAEIKVGDRQSYHNEKNSEISLGRNLISSEYPDIDDDDLKNAKIDDIFEYIEKNEEHDNDEHESEQESEYESDEHDNEENVLEHGESIEQEEIEQEEIKPENSDNQEHIEDDKEASHDEEESEDD